VILCKCTHDASRHVNGDSGEECKPNCGCGEFRLDARSLLQDEPVGWMPGPVREEIAEVGAARKPWVCHCGAIAPYSDQFPHWDCGGGRPLTPEEIAARDAL
jgi:hypothetical protein